MPLYGISTDVPVAGGFNEDGWTDIFSTSTVYLNDYANAPVGPVPTDPGGPDDPSTPTNPGRKGHATGRIGTEPVKALKVIILRITAPRTLYKMLRQGVRTLITCTQTCRLTSKLKVSERVANRAGLKSSTVGRTPTVLLGGKRLWVTTHLTNAAIRKLPTVGPFTINVKAKATPLYPSPGRSKRSVIASDATN